MIIKIDRIQELSSSSRLSSPVPASPCETNLEIPRELGQSAVFRIFDTEIPSRLRRQAILVDWSYCGDVGLMNDIVFMSLWVRWMYISSYLRVCDASKIRQDENAIS